MASSNRSGYQLPLNSCRVYSNKGLMNLRDNTKNSQMKTKSAQYASKNMVKMMKSLHCHAMTDTSFTHNASKTGSKQITAVQYAENPLIKKLLKNKKESLWRSILEVLINQIPMY